MLRTIDDLIRAGIIVDESRERSTAALRGLVTIYTMDYLYRDVSLGPELAARLAADLVRGFGGPATSGPSAPRKTKKGSGNES